MEPPPGLGMPLKSLECHTRSTPTGLWFTGPIPPVAPRSDILLRTLQTAALESGVVGVPEFLPRGACSRGDATWLRAPGRAAHSGTSPPSVLLPSVHQVWSCPCGMKGAYGGQAPALSLLESFGAPTQPELAVGA